MASEPNLKLKSITSRISIRAYAGLMQYLDELNQKGGINGRCANVSDVVRACLQKEYGNVELGQKWVDWMSAEEQANIEYRNQKRIKRKSGFLRRMFHRD